MPIVCKVEFSILMSHVWWLVGCYGRLYQSAWGHVKIIADSRFCPMLTRRHFRIR